MTTKIKFFPIVGIIAIFSSVSHADLESMAIELGKTAIKGATDVAMKKSKTTIENSTFTSAVTLEKSGVLGNVGIRIKGDTTKVKKLTLKNKVKMNKSVVIGNAGIDIGD
jgi:hypothetical protein